MSALNIGDIARLDLLILVGNVATDPTSVKLRITSPSLVVVEFNFPGDVQVVHDGVGRFHADLEITELGIWLFEWFLDGAGTAFDSGEVVTGQPFTLETVTELPAPVPFVDVVVLDSTLSRVLEFQTDGAGLATVFIEPGSYRFVASKVTWRFMSLNSTLLAPSGGPAKDLTIVGATLAAETWLTIEDLELVVSREVIDRLFQDKNTHKRDPVLVQGIILEAQALAESKLLRSWSRESIVQLAFHDHAVRMNAAWIAIELASERRAEFVAADGKGRFWTQYDRAMTFFDNLSKSKDQSRGEKAQTQLGVPAAGVSANTGAARRPRPVVGNNFVFADEGDGTKHGGF